MKLLSARRRRSFQVDRPRLREALLALAECEEDEFSLDLLAESDAKQIVEALYAATQPEIGAPALEAPAGVEAFAYAIDGDSAILLTLRPVDPPFVQVAGLSVEPRRLLTDGGDVEAGEGFKPELEEACDVLQALAENANALLPALRAARRRTHRAWRRKRLATARRRLMRRVRERLPATT